MDNNCVIPWYALENDVTQQKIINRPISASYIYVPEPEPEPEPVRTEPVIIPPKPKPKPKPRPTVNYRSGDVVMMELAVKARKDVANGMPFDWSKDDYYYGICAPWFDEQKARGLADVVYLCGDETMKATGKMLICCLACWYSDGHIECFIPDQEKRGNEFEPAIKGVEVKTDYKKPRFVDNAEAFKNALQTMADYAPQYGWKQTFRSGLRIMQDETVKYQGQRDTFNIQPPFFRYLYAAQVTHLGYGMGSWFDQMEFPYRDFKGITNMFSNARNNAIMYAINNC